MKKLLLGSAALVALASAANAADLPVRTYTKAPIAVPASNWTGFYLFGGGGYGMWADDQKTVESGAQYGQSVRSGGRGWFGTVGGGYDHQFNSSWVAGIFADAQFGDIKGTFDWYGGYYTGSTTNRTNYAVGARFGYLISPNALAYINAGYSHAEFSKVGSFAYYADGTATAFGAPKRSLDGWFIGGGVENSLDIAGISAPGWFMKTEYRVAEYGRKTTNVVDPTGTPYFDWAVSSKPYVQTVSTALVYRFGWNSRPASATGMPVYTKAPRAAYNWTGFYLSGGGGYGLSASDDTPLFPVTMTRHSGGRGWFGSIGGGYDWQFRGLSSTWVAGVFADAQFGDMKGTVIARPDNTLGTTRNKLNYAAGVRLGYLVAPNVLTYANAGYSHADFSRADLVGSYSGISTGDALPKRSFDGWFLGGGIENSLDIAGISAPGWFMKTEYRLAEYDRKTTNVLDSTGTPYAGWAVSSKPYVQTVSTSLVYRFNWGAPLSGK